MAHFTRERSDQDWYRGLRVPETVLRNIDEKTKQAISESGGTWAPTSAIVLSGAGLELQSSLRLSGGAKAQPAGAARFRFGDDYFRYETARTRTIDTSPLAILADFNLGRDARPWMIITQVTAPAIRMRRAGATLRVPLRIPDGARLQSVELTFKVGQTHASLPAELPAFRVLRSRADGLVEPVPNITNSAYEKGGWVGLPVPPSAATYSTTLYTLTATFDATLNDPCDRSVYAYDLEFREESGTNAYTNDVGTYLLHMRSTVSQSDLRPF